MPTSRPRARSSSSERRRLGLSLPRRRRRAASRRSPRLPAPRRARPFRSRGRTRMSSRCLEKDTASSRCSSSIAPVSRRRSRASIVAGDAVSRTTVTFASGSADRRLSICAAVWIVRASTTRCAPASTRFGHIARRFRTISSWISSPPASTGRQSQPSQSRSTTTAVRPCAGRASATATAVEVFPDPSVPVSKSVGIIARDAGSRQDD